MSPTFRVQDSLKPARGTTLTTLLGPSRLGLTSAPTGGAADLLVVHRSTDGPGCTGGVTPAEVDWAKAHALFVEYTGGPATWEICAENHVYCSYDDLRQRLESIRAPATVDDLRSVLLKVMGWPENLAAVYLALVAAGKGVNVLNEISDQVWVQAGKDFHESGGTCGKISPTDWKRPESDGDQGICRDAIRDLFCRIGGSPT